MWNNILTGLLLVFISIVIHGIATRMIIFVATKKVRLDQKFLTQNTVWLSLYITILLMASLLEALVWASVYLKVGAIGRLHDALYFSIVTYTTLGYGDIVLGEGWRLMASIQAANGIIIFGWSTAIIVGIVQKYYFKH